MCAPLLRAPKRSLTRPRILHSLGGALGIHPTAPRERVQRLLVELFARDVHRGVDHVREGCIRLRVRVRETRAGAQAAFLARARCRHSARDPSAERSSPPSTARTTDGIDRGKRGAEFPGGRADARRDARRRGREGEHVTRRGPRQSAGPQRRARRYPDREGGAGAKSAYLSFQFVRESTAANRSSRSQGRVPSWGSSEPRARVPTAAPRIRSLRRDAHHVRRHCRELGPRGRPRRRRASRRLLRVVAILPVRRGQGCVAPLDGPPRRPRLRDDRARPRSHLRSSRFPIARIAAGVDAPAAAPERAFDVRAAFRSTVERLWNARKAVACAALAVVLSLADAGAAVAGRSGRSGGRMGGSSFRSTSSRSMGGGGRRRRPRRGAGAAAASATGGRRRRPARGLRPRRSSFRSRHALLLLHAQLRLRLRVRRDGRRVHDDEDDDEPHDPLRPVPVSLRRTIRTRRRAGREARDEDGDGARVRVANVWKREPFVLSTRV